MKDFLDENRIEHHYSHSLCEYLAWIPFCLLEEFVNTVGMEYFEAENEVRAWIQTDCVCINLLPLLEGSGLNVDDLKEVAQ